MSENVEVDAQTVQVFRDEAMWATALQSESLIDSIAARFRRSENSVKAIIPFCTLMTQSIETSRRSPVICLFSLVFIIPNLTRLLFSPATPIFPQEVFSIMAVATLTCYNSVVRRGATELNLPENPSSSGPLLLTKFVLQQAASQSYTAKLPSFTVLNTSSFPIVCFALFREMAAVLHDHSIHAHLVTAILCCCNDEMVQYLMSIHPVLAQSVLSIVNSLQKCGHLVDASQKKAAVSCVRSIEFAAHQSMSHMSPILLRHTEKVLHQIES